MPTTDTDDGSPPLPVVSAAPIIIALTAFFLILLLTGFFSLFLCRCFLKKIFSAWNLQQNPSGELVDPPENPGLDPRIIRTFPAFPYSSVRDQGTECSICLSDFSDEDTVRLITACRHAFHTDCIDLWFESHKTCPVCRCELEPDLSSPEKSPVLPGINLVRSRSHESLRDAVVIVVQEDGEESVGNSNRNSESHGREMKGCDRRFVRSHSTGHSIVWPRVFDPDGDDDDEEEEEEEEEGEEYSLRFLDKVDMKVSRGHNQTESCITFGELTRLDRVGEHHAWLGDTSVGSITRIVV